MSDIDEHYSAAKPNTYACQMQKMNLLCAYKALLNTDIDKCNKPMRKFLIEKCLFLPKEIPALIEYLGLKNKFGKLNYNEESASFNSREFKVFTMFNPPFPEEQLVKEEIELWQNAEFVEVDDRFERAKALLEERSKELSEALCVAEN